jgi:hypothetical protein
VVTHADVWLDNEYSTRQFSSVVRATQAEKRPDLGEEIYRRFTITCLFHHYDLDVPPSSTGVGCLTPAFPRFVEDFFCINKYREVSLVLVKKYLNRVMC